MIDVEAFGKLFLDKLLTISAENQGVGRIEAVRKYHTNPTYHATVDTIVLAAIQTLQEMQEPGARLDPLQRIFEDEADRMLGRKPPTW